MFGPWIVAFGWLRQRMPKKLSALKPRMNFITLHCAYGGRTGCLERANARQTHT
jgi:hypothetical protein